MCSGWSTVSLNKSSASIIQLTTLQEHLFQHLNSITTGRFGRLAGVKRHSLRPAILCAITRGYLAVADADAGQALAGSGISQARTRTQADQLIAMDAPCLCTQLCCSSLPCCYCVYGAAAPLPQDGLPWAPTKFLWMMATPRSLCKHGSYSKSHLCFKSLELHFFRGLLFASGGRRGSLGP